MPTNCCAVAPLAGAWIETCHTPHLVAAAHLSPPSRGRGLKLRVLPVVLESKRSPPSRGRGLKPVMDFNPEDGVLVAPLAGAWIETAMYLSRALMPLSRPPRGGVD